MKLSIIVPIYNTEKYLRKCIDSILAQTLTDFECILVDDGSTDNCPSICDEYAEKDPRIVVIHKPNGGQSDARNKGLDIAKGDYIGFVDSDDYIDTNMYEDLYNLAVTNGISMVVCKINYIDANNSISSAKENETCQCIIYDAYNDLINDFSSINEKIYFSVCCKLFSRDIFKNIRFPKGLLYEDAYITLDLLECCDKVLFVDKCYYNYIYRQGSTMNSTYSYAHTEQLILCNKMIDFYKKRNLNIQIKKAMVRFVDYYIPNHILINTQFKEYKNNFKIYRNQAVRSIPMILSNRYILKLKKFLFLCVFISPRLSIKICEKYFPELFLWV